MELVCQESLTLDAYGPTNRITPSIKMSKHQKSLYLTTVSTEMAIIHAARDTLCNRVIDLPFKVNGIIFQSVLLWHVYKQGFTEGKTFLQSRFRKTQWHNIQEVWLMYLESFQ